MPSGALSFGFVAAALVVLPIPGPGVLYVVPHSVGQGNRAGLASALGLSADGLVHVAAAAAGLSAILLTSATAVGIVQALGYGYSIYLVGLIYVALATITDSAYAFLAGGSRHWHSGRVMQGPLPRYLSGSLYLGLGVNAVLTERSQ